MEIQFPYWSLVVQSRSRLVCTLAVLSLLFIAKTEALAQDKVYANDKFGYQLSYPATWFPSGNIYANAFEIRNYDPKNPESVSEKSRASLTIADVVNESAEVTNSFLDRLGALSRLGAHIRGRRTSESLFIDGRRAVRLERTAPGQQLGYGAAGTLGAAVGPPPVYSYINTYIADGKHLLSLEAAAQVGAAASVLADIRTIEGSVKFKAPVQSQKGE